MSKYLILPSRTAFEAFQARMNAAFGYPNPATKTERYTEANENDDGQLVAIIDEAGEPLLDEAERAALLRRDQVLDRLPDQAAARWRR